MESLKPLLDELGGDSAVAAHACTCGCSGANSNVGAGKLVESPATSGVGNPALLTVGRGNPDARRLLTVTDKQRPLSLELNNVSVGNCCGGDRVYNDEGIVAQDQLGSQPESVCCQSENQTKQNSKPELIILGGVKNHLNQEQDVEHYGACTPNEVCAGPEDSLVIHESIFATASADGKNYAK